MHELIYLRLSIQIYGENPVSFQLRPTAGHKSVDAVTDVKYTRINEHLKKGRDYNGRNALLVSERITLFRLYINVNKGNPSLLK